MPRNDNKSGMKNRVYLKKTAEVDSQVTYEELKLKHCAKKHPEHEQKK